MRKWLGVAGAVLVLVLSADGADVPDLIKKLKDPDVSTAPAGGRGPEQARSRGRRKR